MDDQLSQPTADDLPIAPDFLIVVSSREYFAGHDYVVVDGLWDSKTARLLSEEAAARREFAVYPQAGPKTPVIKSKVLRRRTPAANGPLLARLHLSLLSFVKGVTGQFLTLGFSAYGYYEEEDRVLLHLDQDECEITVLISCMGEVGPIHLHPDLRGFTPQELGRLESDPNWDRNSGIAIAYPRYGVLIFRGNKIPHHRPGSAIAATHAVAALCYKSPFV